MIIFIFDIMKYQNYFLSMCILIFIHELVTNFTILNKQQAKKIT
jgi:hypothetical protein